MTVAVYLEAGAKRTFAAAVEWPGWCRGGRREDDALAGLLAYGARYRAALSAAGAGADLALPADVADLEVVERIAGDATTDFGAPGAAPSADDRPLDARELDRQCSLLGAAWVAFDTAVVAGTGIELRSGPRGGGRSLDAIVEHVRDAEAAYLSRLGARIAPLGRGDRAAEFALLRDTVRDTLRARADGGPIERPSRARSLWSPRYFVRRAAWHVLDHAWEIEDRSAPAR